MPESDPVIPGMCALLLGLCYEFNREPGEITRCASVSCLSPTIGLTFDPYRSTIYPLLTRLGIDLLVGRITHLRDDDRFKAVGPDTLVLPYPNQGITNSDGEKEAEIWFDWAFVDFWKSNYCERVISLNPTCYLISLAQTLSRRGSQQTRKHLQRLLVSTAHVVSDSVLTASLQAKTQKLRS